MPARPATCDLRVHAVSYAPLCSGGWRLAVGGPVKPIRRATLAMRDLSRLSEFARRFGAGDEMAQTRPIWALRRATPMPEGGQSVLSIAQGYLPGPRFIQTRAENFGPPQRFINRGFPWSISRHIDIPVSSAVSKA